ncbi:GCN5-related N-acetyltransferase [uncultured Croceicoccus sp.]|uniref:GCN5-related N-acetyltransferase n=1 Tax=uncultured Croceicoccus sp. TaxID=1295329 RepID=UPI00260E6BD2|nr:GCN5-related N-acetyltransferase [uncultured Croceicoccus sp.]
MRRDELESEWLRLTRENLPRVAASHGWPVRHDHCFARILLDNACGGRWYDHVAGRPAYRHAPPDMLNRAIALGERCLADPALLPALNARSLRWRGKGGG